MFLSRHVRVSDRTRTLELLIWNRHDIWSLSDCNGTQTTNHLSQRHNYWVYICTVHLSVCFYHVMCTFQSESTLYSCLNVKELFTRNRRDIWSLNDCIILPVWRLFRARSFLEFRQLKSVDLWSVKRIRDMIRTLSQMHRTDKYSQHSSIIWVFVLVVGLNTF